MGQSTEVFVGIDATKERNAIAIADGECGGEVRFLGEVDVSADSMRRLVKRLAAKHERVQSCYEAGPTGYGLHRLITSLGHNCTVVAPSSIPTKPGDRVRPAAETRSRWPECCASASSPPFGLPDEAHEAMRDLVCARSARRWRA